MTNYIAAGVATLAFLGAIALVAYNEGSADSTAAHQAAIGEARVAVTVCQARARDLGALVDVQNEQIGKLADQDKERQAAAARLVAAAQAEAKSARADAARILALPRPAAGTECAAAEALISSSMGE